MFNKKNQFKVPKPPGGGYRSYSRLNNAYQMHLDDSRVEKPRMLYQSNIDEKIESNNWKMPDDRPYYIDPTTLDGKDYLTNVDAVNSNEIEGRENWGMRDGIENPYLYEREMGQNRPFAEPHAGIGTSDETAGLNNWKRMLDEPAQGSAAWSHQNHPVANANAGSTMIPKAFDEKLDGPSTFVNEGSMTASGSKNIPWKEGLTKKQRKNQMRSMRRLAAKERAAEETAFIVDKAKAGVIQRPMPSVAAVSSVPCGKLEKRQKMDIQPNFLFTLSQTIKMTLAKVGFPTAKLSKKEADLVCQEILKKSDEIPEDGQLPKILECRSSLGAVTVQCEDTATVEWLTSNFHDNNSILSGETISVLSANELPKSVIVSFRTQDIFTQESYVLLKRLNRLNPNLRCVEWQTLYRSSDGLYFTWIFEVDPEGFEHIKDAQYKAYTGIDRGVFSVLWFPKGEEFKDKELEKEKGKS